jgi:hypothetical protein
MDEIHHAVRENMQLMSYENDRATNSEGFQKGDLVMLYNPQRKKGMSPKLQTSWEGPYRVIKRLNDVVYRIQNLSQRKSKLKVVHLERLAPYHQGNVMSDRDDQT